MAFAGKQGSEKARGRINGSCGFQHEQVVGPSFPPRNLVSIPSVPFIYPAAKSQQTKTVANVRSSHVVAGCEIWILAFAPGNGPGHLDVHRDVHLDGHLDHGDHPFPVRVCPGRDFGDGCLVGVHAHLLHGPSRLCHGDLCHPCLQTCVYLQSAPRGHRVLAGLHHEHRGTGAANNALPIETHNACYTWTRFTAPSE